MARPFVLGMMMMVPLTGLHCIIIPWMDMMPSVCIDDDDDYRRIMPTVELDPGYLYPIMPSLALILVHIVEREDL